jgi:polyisoprenyl-phosphate glycosyltransferase
MSLPQPKMRRASRPTSPCISVVVPCFNEQEVIGATHGRLTKVLSGMAISYELLFVNDGSVDSTDVMLDELAQRDSHVRVLHFSRNFGQQFAVTAGFDHAIGDCVLLMDADLQDPPELIPDMYGLWLEGHDVVYGQRTTREGETGVKKATSRWFYRTLNALSDVNMPVDTGDFRLVDRAAVDAFNSMREPDRYVRGMVAWVGFDQKSLPYKRDARAAGQTKWNYAKLSMLAADGIMSFSLAPLRLVLFIGFAIVGIAILGGLFAIFNRVFTDNWVSGWTGLFFAVLFMGGVQLMVLGVIGEYVGRIYMSGKERPLYIVKRKVGFTPSLSND